jgi:hypothetical protein
MGTGNVEAANYRTGHSVQHPSSDLPFDKLRVGHLLPQEEKGESLTQSPKIIPPATPRNAAIVSSTMR